MTSRAPVCLAQYAVAMLTFVVVDSLQTDTEQRQYRLVRSIFMAALRSRCRHYTFVIGQAIIFLPCGFFLSFYLSIYLFYFLA